MTKLTLAVAIGICTVLAMPIMPHQMTPNAIAVAFGSSQAAASDRRETRREVRRTIRRIDRRQDRRDYRRNSLPSNCIRIVVNGFPHWRCGSLFYREIIENGVNVYIVVEL